MSDVDDLTAFMLLIVVTVLIVGAAVWLHRWRSTDHSQKQLAEASEISSWSEIIGIMLVSGQIALILEGVIWRDDYVLKIFGITVAPVVMAIAVFAGCFSLIWMIASAGDVSSTVESAETDNENTSQVHKSGE